MTSTTPNPSSVTTGADSTGWSATNYNNTASFVYSAAFTSSILDLLNVQPGEHVIDFGCGSGEVALEIQRRVGDNGDVVGVDFSDSMIEKARANGLEHAFVSDLQEELLFPKGFAGRKEGFDAVFSNATLHWCKRNPAFVLENAKRVLRPGGRIVVEMGGHLNVIGVRSALHQVLRERGYNPPALDPWFFPSVHDYQALLEAASLRTQHISLTPRLTPLSDSGLKGWLNLFARHSFMQDFSDKEAEEVVDEVVRRCEVDCRDGQGKWTIMYVRLRFVAVWDGK